MHDAPYLAISASAGSGKTFQLAHRYVALLLRGVPPDRIAALTFSRKAAGEILDAVVGLLCQSAASNEAARKTAARLGREELPSSAFSTALRALVDALHRTRVGTLDSLIVSIARAFAMELGLPPDFDVGDESSSQALEVRREAFRNLFDPARAPTGLREEFLDAFRESTPGREEKGFGRLLDDEVADRRELYRLLPAEEQWGRANIVWPEGRLWTQPETSLQRALEGLRAELAENPTLPPNIRKRWTEFIEAFPRLEPGRPGERPLTYVLEKIVPLADHLRTGAAELSMERRTVKLSPAACRHLFDLLRRVLAAELDSALSRTAALYRMIRRFDAACDLAARRAAFLTFSDVQHLLAPTHSDAARPISRTPNHPDRLYIDYRLDANLDHWLLDEFQDTSDLQWAVLRNLVDEIVQDDSGERSFFFVGDVKQAIYTWRGGNPRLFGSILDTYGDRIRTAHLTTSFRSGPAVLEAVNRVFDCLPEDRLPAGTLETWAKAWRLHHAAPEKASLSGCAALLEPCTPPGEQKPDEEDIFDIVERLLGEIAPDRRGLSVAILVRTNKFGRRLADYLRRGNSGLRILHEGQAPIADNPVVSALLSLVRFAAHPGDVFSWQHLRMSPLAQGLSEYESSPDRLPAVLLDDLTQKGFRGFLQAWSARLDRAGALDAFARMRLADLLAAAGEFDAAPGPKTCDAFLRFAERYEISESGTEDAVRVMTVHHSKGLGFDVVVAPDWMDESVDRATSLNCLVARDEQEAPRWTLRPPRRLFCEADPTLARALARHDEEAAFDALCVLYVAMTRAKQGLYLVTRFPGASAKAFTFAALLKRQLAGDEMVRDGRQISLGGKPCICHYLTGTLEWFADRPIRPPETPPERPAVPPDFASRPATRLRLTRIEPSFEMAAPSKASHIFDPERRDVLDFGVAIHALFARVEWMETADPEALASQWAAEASFSKAIRRDAVEQFVRAMRAPDARLALARPSPQAVLWREQSFDVVLDNARWVSGVLDRVVFLPDRAGRPCRAMILDFKSDRVDGDAAIAAAARRHAPQMRLYAEAISRMFHLPPDAVESALFFTRPARLVRVAPDSNTPSAPRADTT